MKELSILIVCLSFCSFLKSQTFAPIGTKWGYNYIGVAYSGTYLMESVGDTVIQGKTCRKLVTQNIYYTICNSPVYSNQNISFVEKIGSLNAVLGLGYYCFSDPDYYDLCLFSLGNIQVGGRCNYTKTNDLATHIALKISPNPVTTFLNIETDHSFSDFKIYDLTGKLVKNGVYMEHPDKLRTEGVFWTFQDWRKGFMFYN